MNPTSSAAARAALKSWSQKTSTPSRAFAILSLVNAGGAAAFAFGLAAFLTSPAPWSLAAALAGLGLRAAAGWCETRLASRHARRAVSMVRQDVVRALLSGQRGEHAAVGERLAAAVDEVEALDGYYRRYRPAEQDARLGPVIVAGFAALASPVSAGIMLATLIPFVAILALAGGAAAAASRRQFEALARLSGHFVDRIRALPLILAFEAEEREARRVARAAEEVSRRTLGVLRIAFISSAALEFFAALAVALVAVYCGFSLLGLLPFPAPESLEFRSAFAALALAPEFYAPLRRLAGAYHERQVGEAAAARLSELLNHRATPALAAPALAGAPSVRLGGVRQDFGDLSIGPIDAEIPAGKITAILGPTGSGKSSLLALIAGLSSPSAGSVEISGLAPNAAVDPAQFCAWAGQAPVFLPMTILENLLAAAPGASRAQALQMLDHVGLSPALAARPSGVDTRLDERGSGLSGGERRRLALARALLKPAPLLILDEPTADLDSKAEAQVLDIIPQAAGRRTVVVATHSERLAAIADHVVRLA